MLRLIGGSTMKERTPALPMTVDHHAPCRSCGYDLIGRPLEGVCPECAVAVAESIRGDLLRFADRRWTSCVHRGLRFVFRTVVWLLVISILMIVVLVIEESGAANRTGPAPPSAGASPMLVLLRVLFAVVAIAGAARYAVGWWWASTTDPASGDESPTREMLLRSTGVLAPFALAGWIAMARVGSARILPAIPLAMFAFAALAVVVSHLLLSLGMVQRLTRRCGSLSSEARAGATGRLRLTRAIVVFLAVVAVVLVLHSLRRLFGGGGANSGGAAAVGAAAIVMVAAWLIIAGEFESLQRQISKELAMRPERDHAAPRGVAPGSAGDGPAVRASR